MGNKPYGYIGLGDLSVFIFFGLLGFRYLLLTYGSCWAKPIPSSARLWTNGGCRSQHQPTCVILKTTANVANAPWPFAWGQRKAKQYHFALLGLALASFAIYLLIQEKPVWISLPFLLSIIGSIYKHGKSRLGNRKTGQIAPMMPLLWNVHWWLIYCLQGLS